MYVCTNTNEDIFILFWKKLNTIQEQFQIFEVHLSVGNFPCTWQKLKVVRQKWLDLTHLVIIFLYYEFISLYDQTTCLIHTSLPLFLSSWDTIKWIKVEWL